MVGLGLLLPKLVDPSGANSEMSEVAAKIAWTIVAGAGLRRLAVPSRLYGKTLIVSVADEMWQKQLQAMSPELLFRVNRLLRREVVAFIEFRIDPSILAHSSAKNSAHKQPPQQQRQPIPAELISAASTIKDRDLRDRFLRAADNCIARRESVMHPRWF